MMKIGILTIGNELINGRTADTNSSLIAREVNLQGWHVEAMLSVGDDFEIIKTRLHDLLSFTDAVICTGGLGPTTDDITTEAIARAFDLPLERDNDTLAYLQEIFKKFKWTWTENNAKQALFPKGAQVIPNPVGTAAGFALSVQNKLVLVMPGVPSETKRMLPEGVIPILKKTFPQPVPFAQQQTIKIFGLGESAIDEKLSSYDFSAIDVSVGFYPVFPENHLVLIARASSLEQTRQNLQKAVDAVSDQLGEWIFSYGEQTLEEMLAGFLTQKKLTLAVAESCTGGLIANRLTDVPGSSLFFEQGLVTYSNEAKINLLGVPADIIEKHGAVSEETACSMAQEVRKLAGTDLGLSSTGIAGPSGGSLEKPVGTVYVALADRTQTICRHYRFRWDRKRNKLVTSEAALMLLKNYLQEKK
ncbi:MAG: competence/damage-inducible protein A [Syntrophaceae bacterium]|jgi:nicotinamide-nucleotide amidase|nr:competence/damage-inducible protein A [Syntrophaceae bacterium]HOC60418.1 competence/damage-inducible protein A [Smithellaceae bacterium]HQM45944.1 competence/damage-inducible protein A [Smithellaceae bacterium]